MPAAISLKICGVRPFNPSIIVESLKVKSVRIGEYANERKTLVPNLAQG